MALRFRSEDEMRRVLKLKHPEPVEPEPVPVPAPAPAPIAGPAQILRPTPKRDPRQFPSWGFTLFTAAAAGFIAGFLVALLLVGR